MTKTSILLDQCLLKVVTYNYQTEVDTTVFGRTDIQSNGLGKTTGGGKNTVGMVAQAQVCPQSNKNEPISSQQTNSPALRNSPAAVPFRRSRTRLQVYSTS